MSTKEYFDMLIVAPLEEEVHAIFDHFTPHKDYTDRGVMTYSVRAEGSEATALVVHLPDWGQTQALMTTSRLLQQFSFGTIICVGIAGAVSDDVLLADVCYSHTVLDLLAKCKASDDVSQSGIQLDFTPDTYKSPHRLVQTFSLFRTHPDLRPKYAQWQERCVSLYPVDLDRDAVARALELSPNQVLGSMPATYGGTIFSAFVNQSERMLDQLRKIDRKALAIETESGGIFAAAQGLGDIPVISIRGISDYADQKKKRLEQEHKGKFRTMAANNAATFLLLQLENPFFRTALRHERERMESQSTCQTRAVTRRFDECDFIAEEVQRATEEVEARLREMTIDTGQFPEEFVLPSPRIFANNIENGPDDPNRERLEPIDILQSSRILNIEVPRTYPDETAPWLIAEHVLRADRFETKFIPYVVSGAELKSITRSLRRILGGETLARYAELKAAQPVVIIQNIDLLSAKRLSALFDEVQKLEHVRFVLLTTGGIPLLGDTAHAGVAMARYELCEVSFHSLAEFIRKTFKMTPQQAEVAAFRLVQTFDQFNVTAHPTYFAGMTQETLLALLQANRRAELIQLSVDGFLTFIVADDRSLVPLSRSTRRRFLELLAVEMEVEKRNFTYECLLSFTRNFAEENDFDIDARQFLDGFISRRILVVQGHDVRMGMPFIKHYLLASALERAPELAKRYFDLNIDAIDFTTFDLYCEMAARPVALDDLLKRLDSHLQALDSDPDANSAVFISGTDLTVFGRKAQPERVRKEIWELIERVASSANSSREKERIIDFWRDADVRINEARMLPSPPPVAPIVSEDAAEVKDIVNSSEEADKGSQVITNEVACSTVRRDWFLAVMLLGSAAERLNGAEKRALIDRIVPLARMIAAKETKERSAVDFSQVKQGLLNNDRFRDLESQLPDDGKRAELRKLLERLVDMIEPMFVAGPLQQTLHHLCEEGRQKALSLSIDAVNFENATDEIIKASWLIDVDGERGLKAVSLAFKRLPVAPFLRSVLASHYIMRVYWSHWNSSDREALLEAADEAVRPFGTAFDKGKLRRLIKGTAKDKVGGL